MPGAIGLTEGLIVLGLLSGITLCCLVAALWLANLTNIHIYSNNDDVD